MDRLVRHNSSTIITIATLLLHVRPIIATPSLHIGRTQFLSGILYVTYDVEYGQIPSSFRYRETAVTVRTQKYGLIPHEA
jgi:hypothetical protein